MMHRSPRLVVLALAVSVAAACGGNPPPEPDPSPDADSLARERARQDSIARADSIRRVREREAAAQRLCEQARAAVTAGNYEEARELYRRARSDYGGTDCAERAGDALARIDAVQTVRQRIHFEFDKSDITDQAARVLRRKAQVLRDNPGARIVVEGHCDERGSNEYNMALGQRRAEAARQYLVDLGVSEEVIVRTVSYGEERPLVDRSDEEAWARNRRAEFAIRDLGDL